MSARLIFARRRAALHPGYVRAAQAKINCPPEIYAYPTQARREAANPWKPATVPTVPAPESTPSLDWLPAAYGIVIMALWFVGANVTPGGRP